MLPKPESVDFYATLSEGQIMKSIIDALVGPLQRTVICFKKEGICIKDADSKNHCLFNIFLERGKFANYHCKKEINASINLKHVLGLIKNVRKKDSMVLFINHEDATRLKLGIGIPDIKSDSVEIIHIIFQNEEILTSHFISEEYVSEKGDSYQVYKYPVSIESRDIQKLKKILAIGKKIDVKMQGCSYLSFYSSGGEPYDAEVIFGEPRYTSEEDSETEIYSIPEVEYDREGIDNIRENEESKKASDDSDEDSGTESEEESSDKKNTCENDDYDTDESDEEQIPGLYKASFHTSLFASVIKLASLGNRMRFYLPRIHGFPLKIEMDARQMGSFKIYIKDIDRLLWENKRAENPGPSQNPYMAKEIKNI